MTTNDARMKTKSGSLTFHGPSGRRFLARGGSLVLLLLMAVACTAPRPLAVPEQLLAIREDLPLNDVTRERVIRFIAAGGQQQDGGTAATPIPAVQRDFGKLLDLLKDAQNLRFSGFEKRLASSVPLDDREMPVIDAQEKYPDDLGRLAFLVHNFWFVFYAQKESSDGDPLPVEKWMFDKMVVFRDRPPK